MIKKPWGYNRTVKSSRKVVNRVKGFISRPGLCWFSLAVSLFSNLIALLSFRSLFPGYSTLDDIGLYFVLYLNVSTVLVVSLFFVRRLLLSRIMIAFRVALLTVVVSISPLNTTVGILLVSPLIIEICIYERYPTNLIISCGISLLFLVFAKTSVNSTSFAEKILRFVNYLLYIPLLSFAFSLLMKYREQQLTYQNQIKRLKLAVSRLATANLGYQEYASRAEQVSMLEERKRITREIHDVIGYTMTNNIMMIEAASDMIRRDPDQISLLMKTARENAQNGMEEIRDALHLLRAQEVPRNTGVDALIKLVKTFEKATGVKVRLELGNTPRKFSLEVNFVLYHLIQEALTNSFRHGNATKVRIIFWVSHSILCVTVWDNGHGSEQVEEGIGIAGMRERLEKLGGHLEMANVIDGFKLEVRIPLEAAG
ncbi:MAG: sensor histidine kinase [Spirochaetales bacterium]|nr:sensor histidine kinase [Spirochaetales bacterium]